MREIIWVRRSSSNFGTMRATSRLPACPVGGARKERCLNGDEGGISGAFAAVPSLRTSSQMKPSPALIRHCAAALLAVAAIGLGQAVASAGAADVVTWGRILIIGDGPYGACREKCGAELYDPSSNRFATDPPFIGQG